ncbi:MAG TPA: hypothetical protein VHV83_13445 [Armatimonadota bacterium]|nr:hypothetical protein [Armatimonadota bacterium]
MRGKGEPTSSPDHTQGQFSQRLSWNKVTGWIPTRTFALSPALLNTPIDETKYTHLKIDLKYTGIRPYMHVRGLGEQVDLGDQTLLSTPTTARVEQRGHDAYGEVAYAAYLTHDSRVTRRMVLTNEGYLVIQDEMLPSHMDGWHAGQLWQFYDLQAQGDYWFASASDGVYPDSTDPQKPGAERCMLVRYAAVNGTTTGVERIEKPYATRVPNGRRPTQCFTTYSSRSITAGTVNRFSMVVMPFDPQTGKPADIANRVTIRQAEDGTTTAVIRGLDQTKVTIMLNAARWQVTR